MRNPKRTIALAALFSVAIVAAAQAHTMYLKFDSFFLEPNTKAEIALYNGDFDRSENLISRDRMLDVAIVGPDGRVSPPESAWEDRALFNGPDSLDTAFLTFQTGSAGTYTLGVSTAARIIDLSADEFNEYLVHDGITDAIAQREAAGKTNDPASERYSKHVKAIFQVGDATSDHWATDLGYPAEFVVLQNPYELAVGDTLEVRFLRDGQPISNQLVYANGEFNHEHGRDGTHQEVVTTRTDTNGVAAIPLVGAGRWYVRTIHLVETPEEDGLDYESNWATLTFEIR